VTVSTERLDIGTAACIVPAGAERTIFALPWYGRMLVGTTDNDYDGDIDHVPPSGDDIEYLLDALNSYFGTELGPDDLTGAYAGVRPLISSGDPKKSVDISRKAELYETSSGMLTITGGKLTTFRRMAAQVVDRIVERDGREAECRTDDIPLGMAARPEDLETSVALPDGATDQLAFRYGHAARAVLDVCEERPELAEPIVPGRPDLLAEVVIAARREQARSVSDVLLRRTRLGLLAAPELRDGEVPIAVARVLREELGWSQSRVAAEHEAWSRVADAEGLDPVRMPAQ
jgi:glycerol-3-phosphate dehydrogenase